MPPCPISSPPSLALAMPWEMPGGYATVLFLVVVYGYIVRSQYANAAKPLARRTRIAFILVVAGSVTGLVGIAVFSLVLEPYMRHIVAWHVAQAERFAGQPCSLDPLHAREQVLLAGAFTSDNFVFILTFGGLAVFVIGALLMRAARPRPAAEIRST